jgi:hypothetical protein
MKERERQSITTHLNIADRHDFIVKDRDRLRGGNYRQCRVGISSAAASVASAAGNVSVIVIVAGT